MILNGSHFGRESARRARLRDREHSEAFGDSLDRDVRAEFGAGVSLTVGPKLSTAAPVATAPKIMISTSAVASALKAAPKLSTVPVTVKPGVTVAPAPKPTSSAARPAPVPAPAPVKPAPAAVKLAPASASSKASADAMFKAGAAAVAAAGGNTAALQTTIKGAPAPKPTSSAPSSKTSKVATTAQTGNFLEAGSGPLTAPNVQAPKETAAQKAAREKAVAAAKAAQLKLDAQKQAQANVQYAAERTKIETEQAAYVKRMQTENTPEAKAWRARQKQIHSAGVDWGLIPAGAAVIATGAAIIATGGAVAGAIAAPSAAGVLGAAVAADRALAAAEKAKLVKPGAAGVVGSALDVAAAGQTVIDATNRLASEGVPAAIEGAKVLAATAAQRVASGALPGVPQALTPEGAKAYADYLGAVPPALAGALDAATVKPSFSGAVLATGNYVQTSSATKPALAKPSIVWFVSDGGHVVRGAGSGRGWAVYSDGKVVQR